MMVSWATEVGDSALARAHSLGKGMEALESLALEPSSGRVAWRAQGGGHPPCQAQVETFSWGSGHSQEVMHS